MNNKFTAIMGVLLLAVVVGFFYFNQTHHMAKLSTDKDKTSYAVGFQLGRPLANIDTSDISIPAVVKGLEDSINKTTNPLLTEQEMQELLQKLSQEIQKKMAAKAEEAGKVALERANQYLADNLKKTGVKKTDSGIQYVVLEAGSGKTPTKDDVVEIEFEAKLMDGKVVAAKDAAGKPTQFRVSQTVPGMTEILQLMPAGSHWQVIIPPALAFGAHGFAQIVGPNELLICDVKLLNVKPAEEQKADDMKDEDLQQQTEAPPHTPPPAPAAAPAAPAN